MSQTIRFLHVTDLHISDPGTPDPNLWSDTATTLTTVKAMIAGIDPAPAFIAISGDLTNRGDPESYRMLRDMMADIGLPVICALGNHDDRAAFYTAMLGRNHDLTAPYDHDVVMERLHVIVLDSSVPGRIGGALDEAQFAFLEKTLDRHADLPKLIVLHHPPSLEETGETDWDRLNGDDSARLADMLEGHEIAGILCGHIHQDRISHWHGVPVVVSTGLHSSIDPLHSDGLRVVSGAGFALCTLRDSGLTVGFVPLPSDRHDLVQHSFDELRQFETRAAE